MLDLTREELDLMKDLMESAYRDLKEEIYKTEDYAYKSQLKGRERTLESIMRKITQAAAAAGS